VKGKEGSYDQINKRKFRKRRDTKRLRAVNSFAFSQAVRFSRRPRLKIASLLESGSRDALAQSYDVLRRRGRSSAT